MRTRRLFVLACALLLAIPVAAQVRSGFILEAATTTTSGPRVTPRSADTSFHAYGETSAGSGAATILIEVSQVDVPDTNDWITACTITLTLGTTRTGDACSMSAPWRSIRARVSALSGTGASVNVRMGG